MKLFNSFSTPLLLVLSTVSCTIALTSQQCQEETSTLSSNDEIQTALTASLEGVAINGNDCSQSGNSISCNIDFTSISGDFATVCGNHGGQVFTTDIHLSCTNADSSATNFLYNEFPECIGASCDLAKYEEQAGALFELLGGLSGGGDGSNCEFELGDLTDGGSEDGSGASNLRNTNGSSGAIRNRHTAALIAGMSAFAVLFL